MSAAVSTTLASVLRVGRGELNARFAAARVHHPDLDAEVFAEFVRGAIDPLVEAVERVRPDRVTDVALAAYDVALELVGQKLVGYSAHTPYVDEAWRRVLPEVAPLVAAEPERLIAAVCNAAHQLSATPGVRPAAWIDVMARLAAQCADSATFLTLGQVVAWRAGMAHFRESALAAAGTIAESLALAAIGAPAGRWSEVRGRLAVDPWYDPALPNAEQGAPRVASRAGAFRGFGGLFTEPPTVAMADERLFVRAGTQCWLLTADAFGATFHRATPGELERGRAGSALPKGISVRGTSLTVGGSTVALPDVFEQPSSACASRTTLALTSPYTHEIALVALPLVGLPVA
ncbi:MAG TPA: hypothetical protein VM076_13500 [Gemmatimonadaceae bacterium]|nr:hypothetical protein [Gemmatimonadaceae bacterium]